MRKIIGFNDDWQYYGADMKGIALRRFDISGENVTLPHCPIEKQGACYYRKIFKLSFEDIESKKIFLDFEGIENRAKIYINGILTKIHGGGFFPFSIDITGLVKIGVKNAIVIKTDARREKDKTPTEHYGKSDLKGKTCNIIRCVNMRIVNKIYIPNCIGCGRLEGGVFAFTEKVQDNVAYLRVNVAVRNTYFKMRRIIVKTSLFDADGIPITELCTKQDTIKENCLKRYDNRIQVIDPELWSVERPYLYSLQIAVYSNDELVDTLTMSVGLRTVEVCDNGLYVNGENVEIIENDVVEERAKEYDNIESDIIRAKEMGFNAVRPSKRVHSENFMEICDKIGVFVIVPSVVGGTIRGAFSKRNRKKLYNTLRCNGNHPSAVMYESPKNGIKDNRSSSLVKTNSDGEQEIVTVKVGALKDISGHAKDIRGEYGIPFIEYENIRKSGR